MMDRNNIKGFDNFPILDSNELSKVLTKLVLLENFIREGEENHFLKLLLNNTIEGYIKDEPSQYDIIKDIFFSKKDRFGRRKIITDKLNKKELISYLKDIILKKTKDSCVLYINSDSNFFEEILPMVSPSILLGNVKYLANVTSKINKNPNLTAIVFGYHCSSNSFWIQASIDKKEKIYKLLS